MFDIGGRIKELRTAKGLQQEELADMVGITRESLSRMERNKVSSSIETLQRICDALGVSLRHFFNAPESELPPEVRSIAKSVMSLNEEQRRTLDRFLRSLVREGSHSEAEKDIEQSEEAVAEELNIDVEGLAAHMEGTYGIASPEFRREIMEVIRRVRQEYFAKQEAQRKDRDKD